MQKTCIVRPNSGSGYRPIVIYWICTLLFIRRLLAACPPRAMLIAAILILFLPFALLTGQGEKPNIPSFDQGIQRSQPTAFTARKSFVINRLDDLGEIKQRGRLRVLVSGQQSPTIHLTASERTLIELYAQGQNLGIDWIEIGQPQQLFSYLHQGKGDIALTLSASVPADSAEKVQLTLPWGVSQQQVISRSDTGRIRHMDDLATRQIAIKVSSPVWERLQAQAKINPSMGLVIIPETEGIESILQKVDSAQYDVTVLDNLVVETRLSSFLNLEVAFNASDAKMISWAVRSTSKELTDSLNSFLNKQYLRSQIVASYQDDLPQLQVKKLLRLITYQSPVNYYLHRGKLKGFEHDLVKRFAESHQMRLDVVIADSHEEMQQLLMAGKGDLVAASLPRSSLIENKKLAFTRAYSHAAPVVIGRTKDTPLLDVRALSGRRIVLPAASPYQELVQKIKSQGVNIDLVIADVGETSESILFRVAIGVYDLTVIGGHEIKAQFSRQINVRAHFTLTEPLPHVWAVRETDTLLLTALNEFISKEFRKGFYNVLYAKYIDEPRPLLGDTQLLARTEKLSPYDDIVHKYAEHYSFDWRLIVAQMYQESQFDPNAISYAGAEGLMQLIPETADLLGIADTYDPVSSIRAGIRYMDYLRSKFEDDQLLEDRIWFSLAAYNAGYNRVYRARQLAENMNLDKNKWFDNVEKAMLALSRPYWREGEVVRNCRCGQTVVYVRDIRTLYNNYVRLTRSVKTVSNTPEFSQDI